VIIQSTADNKASLLAAINDLLRRGSNGGSWDGAGITSSKAAADANHLTGIGAIVNDNGDGTVVHDTLDGEAVDANTVLLHLALYGDVDWNAIVDADDYFRFDKGFSLHLTNYINGDVDYSGKVDADDYFRIDKSFGFTHSGAPAAAMGAAVIAQPLAPPTDMRKTRARHHRRITPVF
jgi:hypothetical protein